MRRLFFALLLLTTPVTAAPKVDQIESYRALVAQDVRLATVGYRLALANARFCFAKERKLAWVIHDVAQYHDMAAAFEAFLFHEPVSVAAVVPGGPADKAGIKSGDGVGSVGETSFDFTDEAGNMPTSKRVELVNAATKNALALSSAITLGLSGPMSGRVMEITPPPVCASDFWVDTRSKIDAGADGEKVRITTGLMAYVADDAELAAVVAHELSHNLLGHRAKLNGMRRGKTKATRNSEDEADRLSVWLMANAGYDPSAALRFWERYGRRFILMDSQHRGWKQRVAIIQAEIALIGKAEVSDSLRDPPLLQAYRDQQ